MRVQLVQPCIENATDFDCNACDIGPNVECRYRSDDTLRHERAERLSRSAGVARLGETTAKKIAAACRVILEKQGLALPARSLVKRLPVDLSRAARPDLIEWILRNSLGIRETSPGMFKWEGTKDALSSATIAFDSDSGSAIARLLAAHPPLSPEIRRQRFKRLAGLRKLAEYRYRELALNDLTAIVDRLAPIVLHREGWRISEAAAFAVDGSRVPARWKGKSEAQVERYDFLSATAALEIATEFSRSRIQGAIQYRHRLLLQQLLSSNIRLVASEARKFADGFFLTFADLFQSGFEGLMRAGELYDPYLGYEFSTYATNWIRQAIGRTKANEERTVRIPVHAAESLDRMTACEDELYVRLGRQPLLSEIAAESGVADKQVEVLNNAAKPVLPLSAELVTNLRDPRNPFEDVESAAALTLVRHTVQHSLNDFERTVVELRFGFAGEECQTLEAIGQQLGYTRERIRQVQKRALEKIESHNREALYSIYEGSADLG